jgi:hypothetical protein
MISSSLVALAPRAVAASAALIAAAKEAIALSGQPECCSHESP